MYCTFLAIVGTLPVMLPLYIGALLSVCHVALYLFLFLFNLSNHYVSNSSYCYRYLYYLGLVLLVQLLTLLVYNFPYGDLILN